MKYLNLSIIFVAALSLNSMDNNEIANADLPTIELKQESIRLVFQTEAAFLNENSSYDYFVTTHLWPCAGLVFSHRNYHLLVHKDDLVDVSSINELLPLMGVLQNDDRKNVKVTIFSRKMREEIYEQKKFSTSFAGRSQEQELARVKGIIESFGIPSDNIRLILSNGLENSLVVNKQGQVFKASHLNKIFYAVDGIEKLTRSGSGPMEEFDKRKEIDNHFINKSKNRILAAYENWPKHRLPPDNLIQLKPYMNQLDAPKNWPVLNGTTCAVTQCHEVAKLNCSRCRRAHYCSTPCQKRDWPSHKKICGQ